MGFSRQEYWNGMPLPSPSLLDKGVCLVEGAEWKGNLWLGHEKPLWFQMSREDVILDLSFWLFAAVQRTPPVHSLHARTAPTAVHLML